VKPAPFDYLDPTTVEDTVGLLAEFADEAKLLAGGQSLVPMLNLRLARPAKLVDINGVTGLDHLGTDGGELVVGALTRQRLLEGSPLATGAWSLLPAALHHVGHAHIRNRGTVGGSIAHADPAAELPAAVCALGARMVVRGVSGTREVAADGFFRGYFTTAVEPDELLTEIRIPGWPARSGGAFVEVARRHGDFAQIGVAAAVALGGDGEVVRAGVAVAGAATAPVIATEVVDGLAGRRPTAALAEELAGKFAAGLAPPSDLHGSAAYRRQLVRHLLPRAIDRSVRAALDAAPA
jgi:carbon-monoxide dehydrogenase medium subunit